jgi:hypothetical protein
MLESLIYEVGLLPLILFGLLIATLVAQRSERGRAARKAARVSAAWLVLPPLASWFFLGVSGQGGGTFQVVMLVLELLLAVWIAPRYVQWPGFPWSVAAVSLVACATLGVPVLTREHEVTAGSVPDGRRNAYTEDVSREFGKPQLLQMYARMMQLAPTGALDEFNCGEPVPTFQFKLTLEPEREYRERLVSVVSTPELDLVNKDRCLYSGLSHMTNVVLADIDRGKPVDYGYTNSGGGTLEPWKPGHIGRKPVCLCDKRDSREEWVIYPPDGSDKTEQ